MGANGSAYEEDDDTITVMKGVRLTENVINRMRGVSTGASTESPPTISVSSLPAQITAPSDPGEHPPPPSVEPAPPQPAVEPAPQPPPSVEPAPPQPAVEPAPPHPSVEPAPPPPSVEPAPPQPAVEPPSPPPSVEPPPPPPSSVKLAPPLFSVEPAHPPPPPPSMESVPHSPHPPYVEPPPPPPSVEPPPHPHPSVEPAPPPPLPPPSVEPAPPSLPPPALPMEPPILHPPSVELAPSSPPASVEPVSPTPSCPVGAGEEGLCGISTREQELRKGLEQHSSLMELEVPQRVELEEGQTQVDETMAEENLKQSILADRAAAQDHRLRAHLYAHQLEQRVRELRKQDAIYREQVAKLELKGKRFHSAITESYQQASREVSAKFRQYQMNPVCADLQREIVKCYRENSGQTLSCSKIASLYLQCVSDAQQNKTRPGH